MLDLVAHLSAICPHVWSWSGAVSDDAWQGAAATEWRWVDERGCCRRKGVRRPGETPMPELSLFEDTASHRHLDPNKIWCQSLSLPVVASGFYDWRRRFADTAVGLFLDPRRPLPRSLHASASDTPIGRR